MDFSFTEEQKLFRKSVREFCEKKLAPRASEIDEKGEIPHEVLADMATFGLLGITISEEYGGSGADFVTAAIAAEEIARADISMATAVYYLVEAGWGFLMDRYGNKRAKEEILPDVTKGKKFLGIASTEAGGGSDIASISTTMEKNDGKLVVNGAKTFISGVREAAKYGGGYVTIVKTSPELKHKGLSLCYLPVKDIAGITTSIFKQMGREGISTGTININNVGIPSHYLIGEWDNGFYYAMEGFNCARTLVAAACIGAAEKALESGIEYIKERHAFGTSLARFEGIQFQLAEDYIKLESARLLVYKAAWMLDQMYTENRFNHKEINKAVACAKLIAPTVAFDIIKDVLTWHGAYGYTKEAGLERGLRGVASYIIGAEGAQNIMKIIIGREILGKEFAPY
ncbi:acyl-CoA dehydrogenase [Candidatus Methanoperedens nitroreducens]|uniref:Acyl-CoA dehydrogenase n=1 Tax=Candidatus Methanoperedens nitratireducens TaxID=1392998 RepID=A0A062V979_9EURY|nr:acyl-CoA dehydrogenase family protein [Candidatus Methanoperedens nitroreducens]KCZ71900.1 acyl-CoA dehydrogenase [Candidatus Methanoperedens nitroreducens]MDJ1422127.1 acyl-CoA dehydrogenase family protein [Candidatus Methanoperedens sp.]